MEGPGILGCFYKLGSFLVAGLMRGALPFLAVDVKGHAFLEASPIGTQSESGAHGAPTMNSLHAHSRQIRSRGLVQQQLAYTYSYMYTV